MVFVTVGTHEQQFNRLVEAVDKLKGKGTIAEEVIIQTGFSDYAPQYCESRDFFSYQQMVDYVDEARVIITHGGPSSFNMALQNKKIPIVVPRQKKFGEHVNDHQVEYCRIISERQKNILLVEDIDKLGDAIINYDSLTAVMPHELQSNNAKFCSEFEKVVNEIMSGKDRTHQLKGS